MLLKKLVVILVVFSILFQNIHPVYAQDSKQEIINDLGICHEQLFDNFKTAFHEETGTELEVTEEFRSKFLVHMSIPESEKFSEYAMYSMASLVYVALEYTALKIHKTFDFRISNAVEASEWRVMSWNFQKWLAEGQGSIQTIEAQMRNLNVTAAEQSSRVITEAELRVLEKQYADAAAHKVNMDRLLAKYDKQPRLTKIRAGQWFWGMVAVQCVLLAGYIIWLHEIGHKYDGSHNSPIGYNELKKSTSPLQYQALLNMMDISTVEDLYRGCQESLKLDMNTWIRSLASVGQVDIDLAWKLFKTSNSNQP